MVGFPFSPFQWGAIQIIPTAIGRKKRTRRRFKRNSLSSRIACRRSSGRHPFLGCGGWCRVSQLVLPWCFLFWPNFRTRAIWKCRCFFSRCFTDKRTTFVEQVQMNRIRMFLQQSHQPLPTCGQHHGTDLLGGEWKPGPQDAGAQRVWQDDPGDWGWNEQWQTDCKGSLTDLTESWWGKPPTRQGVIPVHYFCIFLFDPWCLLLELLSTQHFRCRLHTWRSLNLHKPCFMCSSARLHLDSIGSRNGGGCGGVGCASNLPMKGKSWFTFGACLWTDKATVYHI